MFEGRLVKMKECKYGTMLFFKHDMYIGKALDLYGEFSEAECCLFRELVPEGSVVVDVGANIGCHTVMLSKLTGPSGKVIAIEAQRRVFNVLCANLALNDIENTVCHHMGAGRNQRTAYLPVPDFSDEENIGGIGIHSSHEGNPAEEVQIRPLDDLMLDDVHFLKIDVEGMELDVLLGAEKTIKACRPIIYVENDRKEKSERLINQLFELGYDVWWHLPLFYNPDNFLNNADNVFESKLVSVNLLCLPKEVDATVNNMFKVTSTLDTADGKPQNGCY